MEINTFKKKITELGLPSSFAGGFRPTPCYRHEGISKELGIEFYIKREDRIDDLGCGNKFRRLSYVVPHAKQQGATSLITVGSLPSNQCKAVAFFGKQYGMHVNLIFGGDTHARPDIAYGNYLLTALQGAEVSWFDYAPWEKMDEKILAVAEKEKAQGRTPYTIISGAPEWPGILGSVDLGCEISEQMGALAHQPLKVIVPAGSGGTCLGIAIAAEVLNLPWQIYGVVIGENIPRIEGRIEKIRRSFSEQTGIPLSKKYKNLSLWDKALGNGYDRTQDAEIDEMVNNFKDHGLIFDLNYMVKAFIGLRQLKAVGHITDKDRTLLVHTGGYFGLFDYNPALPNWINRFRPEWVK